MGTCRNKRHRRKASSVYQAGALAFGALGVFVLARLAERMGMGPLGWIAAALIALPSLAAFAAPEQSREEKLGIRETFAGIWHEFKATFIRWRAIPYTLTMLFSIAS